MFSHVIWDMGGTLVDTYPQLNAALAGVVAAHGGQIPVAEVARLTHVSTGHAIETLSERHGIDAAEFEAANAELKRQWESAPAPVMAGAHEVMADVSARGGLNLVATHRDRRSAMSLLETLGLVVDDLVCPEDGFARKPDPAMYEELLRRHRLRASDVICAGDRPIDAQAAHAAGIAAAHLGTSVPCSGSGSAPDLTLSALSDLLPILDSSR